MSMENYGKTGYGFEVQAADFGRVMEFVKKYLPDDWNEYFKDMEDMDEIVEVCCEDNRFGYESDASGILAWVISRETKQNVEFCADDTYPSWVMLIPSFPWEDTCSPMNMLVFEKMAGELAMEFYGKPVLFDYHTTECWG